jgi:DNA-binding CsgD family transcriptional regulator
LVTWGFVGRDEELAELVGRLALRSAKGIVLAGPAGVGKTRLASEFLRRAEGPDTATAHITASMSTSRVPFGAFASLLPAGDYPEKTVGSRAAMLRTAASALVRHAGGRRLVLLVDDAHLLDDASATLVSQLVSTDSAFVVATVRSGEQAPPPIVGLWKDDLVDRIEVGGLGAEAIEDLLCAELGGQVDSAVVARLVEHCRGNVLFLRELVLGAVRDGSLVNERGIWRLVRPLAPSERLVELVEARLGDLHPDERSLMELVCWGEPLEIAELVALADLPSAERLEERGFLATRMEGDRREVRPAHPVYGDVVRAQTPTLRVARLAKLLADTVESRGLNHPRDVLRVAAWRLDGGGGSPEVMLAAAQAARWTYDFRLAERLVERALVVGAGFDAALLAAELAGLLGRFDDAEAQLAQLSERADTDQEKALVALSRLNNHAFYSGAIDQGLQIVDDALRTIEDQDAKDEIAARRAGLLLAKGGPTKAAEVFEPLLEQGCNDRALVWAYQIAAPAYTRLGRFSDALDTGNKGYLLARSLSRPSEWYPWIHLYFRSRTLTLSGRLLEGERLAKRDHEAALENWSVEAQAWFSWGVASASRERGDINGSIRYAREATALFAELGRSLVQREALIDLATSLASAGRGDEARASLDTLDGLGLPPSYLTGVDLLIARGWVEAAAGELPMARRHLEDAADVGERIGDLVGVVTAIHNLARIGGTDAHLTKRLNEAVDLVEGDYMKVRAVHVRGLLERDVDRLESASNLFEAAGARLLAAEVAADAGETARAAGNARRAAAAEFRSAGLLNSCDGAVLVGRQGRTVREVLTRAEQEAALLAAAGRSNRSIAHELCLSVRTVEGRLQRVYTKLGVASREELSAKLAESQS